MRLYLILITSLLFQHVFAQTDTLWFDKNWKPTGRNNAAFFRPPLKHEGERYYLTDYYINGNKQMEGWSFDTEGKELDGKVIYYHPNGQVQSELHFANKKGNGEYKEYTADGNLRGTSTIVNGLTEGDVYSYKPDGKLQYIAAYKNGKRNGISRIYGSTGHLQETYTYFNDSLEGEGRVYFEDSTLRAVVYYSNNKKSGEWLEYYKNGKLRGKANYKNGALDGPWTEYYDNGTMKGSTQFKNNKPDGLLRAWFSTGKPDLSENYSNGLKNGKHSSWYYNGHLKEEGNFTNDEKSGEWKLYNDSGKVVQTIPSNYAKKIADYKLNVLKITPYNKPGAEGHVEQRYNNDAIKMSGAYFNGKKDGTWYYWNPAGDITLKENYLEGKLNGPTLIYNTNGTIIKEIPYKDDLLHGMVVEFDDSGRANLNLYFMDGRELYDATEFYKKFYKKGVTSEPGEQVIEMDKLEQTDGNRAIEIIEQSYKMSLDTVSNKDGIVKLTTTVERDYFNSESKALANKVIVNVIVTQDGVYIIDEHKKYKAADDNELTLFIEDNTGDISGQEIGFRIGKNVKTALQNGSLRVSEVIKFFSERVFDKKFFSGLEAGDALEREFK